MSPSVGNSRPSSNFMVVVLPEPLGPSRPNTSPFLTSRREGVDGPDFFAAPEVAVNLRQIPNFNDRFRSIAVLAHGRFPTRRFSPRNKLDNHLQR